MRSPRLSVVRTPGRRCAPALAGMLSDLHDHPELRASVIDDLEQQVREQFAALLARAVARGEVRPFDVDVLLDALIGVGVPAGHLP